MMGTIDRTKADRIRRVCRAPADESPSGSPLSVRHWAHRRRGKGECFRMDVCNLAHRKEGDHVAS
jgi:hypothetical protein